MVRLPIVWSPLYEVDIGPHVFPTRKYRLVRDLLLRDDVVDESSFVSPEPASWDELTRVHTPGYLGKIQEDELSPLERMRLEVPFSAALREASILCCGGTLLTGRLAVEGGVAAHLGGGFHHAFGGHGEGFCLLNDVAVAAAGLVGEGLARRVAIVDLDVHHGNGTADIFADEDRVFTFSMHEDQNYPAVKPPSDLDVGLPRGTGDSTYLALLEEHLPQVLERGRPDLVFYLAGADPYREDQLGGLDLSLDGLRRRDRMVLEACARHGVPVGVLLAGGYAFRQSDTVRIHAATVEEAARVRSRPASQ
jgi:acetoin utilization deacetylase AcuC-like enzyme